MATSKKKKSAAKGKLKGAKAKLTAKAAKPFKKAAKKAATKMSAKSTAKPKSKTAIKLKPASKAQAVKNINAPKTKSQPKAGQWEDVFVPLDDRLLVRLKGVSEKTQGGIFIPSTVESRPNQGEVLSVGRGHLDKKGKIRPLDVQIGDAVLFSDFAGTKTVISGEDLLILRESDVLGVVAD